MSAARFVHPKPVIQSTADFVVNPRGFAWAHFSPDPALPGGDLTVCMADGRTFSGKWSVVGVESADGKVFAELRIRGYAAARMSREQYKALCLEAGKRVDFDYAEVLP